MKIDEQEFRMFLKVPAVCPERMISKMLVKSDTVWFPAEVNENDISEFR